MEFAPNAAAGVKGEQSDAPATVAERHHEQTRAAVLAGAGIANQRALAVIDLSFLVMVSSP